MKIPSQRGSSVSRWLTTRKRFLTLNLIIVTTTATETATVLLTTKSWRRYTVSASCQCFGSFLVTWCCSRILTFV